MCKCKNVVKEKEVVFVWKQSFFVWNKDESQLNFDTSSDTYTLV